jgi:hypothetical protein|tara:strand:+ start:75 stop:824 length:750 start_codon:yes stop_codon:yes gene_type:complete
MAYFTGKDVDVWVTTEHEFDYLEVTDNELVVFAGAAAGATKRTDAIFSGALTMAGMAANRMTDVSGCDVSVGAVDEDISFFGLRNVGKIEVKKDTSVSITRKKSDNKNMVAFQGTTNSTHSYSSGTHSARWGLIENTGATAMVVADGTVDPKSTLDDGTTAGNCYGYRVFVELKADSTGSANDGVVMIVPNCTMMEYSSTVSNDAANEETFTFSSMVKPIIYSGDTSGTNSCYGSTDSIATAQTTAANM